MSASSVLVLDNVTKSYHRGDSVIHALDAVNLTVDEGDYLAIMGPSGSGKSTLMNVLGCLDSFDSGSYQLAGHDMRSLDENRLAQIRNRSIGFVFQHYNLLPDLTALANVELPLVYAGVSPRERRRRAEAALVRVGLANRQGHAPTELSGGQQQRVSVARALVTDPTIILADEPTGNLDSESTVDVLSLFEELHEDGRTIVLITHEDDVAQRAARRAVMRDGTLSEQDVA